MGTGVTRPKLAAVMIALYVAGVVGLAAFVAGDPDDLAGFVGLVTGFFLAQALFLFGSGRLQLQRPIKRSHLIIPAAVGALLMALLSAGMGLALAELYYLQDDNWAAAAWLTIVITSWFFWGFVFLYVYSRYANPGQTLTRMTGTILSGSLFVLLVTIPAHIVVSKRPGCFVGLGTAMGIGAGLVVMLWAFGPGLVLLFLNERCRHELRHAQKWAHPIVDG
jgi:hypothetical protein